ncbi:DNA-binding protein inhibitor ID-2-B-like [Macrobrachium rosenbergii]|uniref:DNA-binding protein inhibitor ID-2-B-like n=1 Tax=Macrobrachium rosenbergii TaxID=79674 RepID=UPI0034D7A45D
MKSVSWNKSCHRSVRSNSIGVRSNRCHADVRQERQEIRDYLDKLRQLVPACPKAGKLSRLAVIQYVIDYIVELQDTLVHHPVNSILGNGDIADLTSSIHSNPIFSLQALNASSNKNSTSSATASATNKNDNHVVVSGKTTTAAATINNDTSSKRSKTSSTTSSSTSTTSATCRRPLGVLSSFKNHRNL